MRPGVERVVNGDPVVLSERFAAAEPLRDEWEPKLYGRFKAALAPGMTVLDVGASFGLYAIAAARAVGPGGRVYAFEPAAASAAALRRHLEWNGVAGGVEVVEAAVADHSGAAVFWQQETSFVASLVEAAVRAEEARYGTPVQGRRVAVVALDDFCRDEHVCPDVIKVDVEGAEGRVLRGARGLLAERRPLVFLEVHAGVAAGRFSDPLAELERAGFRCEQVAAQGAGQHYVCAPAGR